MCGPMYEASSSFLCLILVLRSPEIARKEEGGRDSASLLRSLHTLGLRSRSAECRYLRNEEVGSCG